MREQLKTKVYIEDKEKILKELRIKVVQLLKSKVNKLYYEDHMIRPESYKRLTEWYELEIDHI